MNVAKHSLYLTDISTIRLRPDDYDYHFLTYVLLDITTVSNGSTVGSNRKVITTINKTVNLLSPLFSPGEIVLKTGQTECSAHSAHVLVLFTGKTLQHHNSITTYEETRSDNVIIMSGMSRTMDLIYIDREVVCGKWETLLISNCKVDVF